MKNLVAVKKNLCHHNNVCFTFIFSLRDWSVSINDRGKLDIGKCVVLGKDASSVCLHARLASS